MDPVVIMYSRRMQTYIRKCQDAFSMQAYRSDPDTPRRARMPRGTARFADFPHGPMRPIGLVFRQIKWNKVEYKPRVRLKQYPYMGKIRVVCLVSVETRSSSVRCLCRPHQTRPRCSSRRRRRQLFLQSLFSFHSPFVWCAHHDTPAVHAGHAPAVGGRYRPCDAPLRIRRHHCIMPARTIPLRHHLHQCRQLCDCSSQPSQIHSQQLGRRLAEVCRRVPRFLSR